LSDPEDIKEEDINKMENRLTYVRKNQPIKDG